MNDAERYRAELDQLMRDTEVKAEHTENRSREATWKAMEKLFNQRADELNWSPQKRAVSKKYLLDHFWD